MLTNSPNGRGEVSGPVFTPFQGHKLCIQAAVGETFGAIDAVTRFEETSWGLGVGGVGICGVKIG